MSVVSDLLRCSKRFFSNSLESSHTVALCFIGATTTRQLTRVDDRRVIDAATLWNAPCKVCQQVQHRSGDVCTGQRDLHDSWTSAEAKRQQYLRELPIQCLSRS